ncbi:MAG: hypothetical protein AAGI15_08295 [Pseudomonadota bacterium]
MHAAQPPAAPAQGCEVRALSEQAFADYDFESPPPSLILEGEERVRVTELRVRQQRVFQEETPWFKRLANRYHVQTRERVLTESLPFDLGDAINARHLAEAERILRLKPYLFEAAVVISRRCAGADGLDEVRVDVIARDVWTLNPRLVLTRTGSQTDFGAGVSDSNWFGTGIAASIAYISDEDRSGISVVYQDQNLLGSRWRLNSLLIDSDDGHLADIILERPFFALDTRYSLGMRVRDNRREQGLFFLSDELFEFDVDAQFAALYAGRQLYRSKRAIGRVLAGVAHSDQRFEFPTGFPGGDPDVDRRFTYPYLAYQQVADQFVERVNLDRIQRTEDIALGTALYAEVGYAPDAFGSDGDHWLGNASLRHTRWLSRRALMSIGGRFEGRYDRDERRSEEVIASAFAAFQFNHAQRFSLLARGSYFYTNNLPVDRQLLLGGDVGLRGYPNRYQSGDRGYLLTVEERYYSDLYPFEMFRLGAAVFADVGRVSYRNDAPAWVPAERSADEFGTLANVGFGLRLESTRTRRDRILHVDFAVPLVDGPNVKGLEVTVVAKQSL